MTPPCAVRDLRTHVFTRRGVVKAVNGVSFQVRAGETLGLVGESGSGKTMTCLSILRLLPRGARIVSGEIWLQGTNLAAASEAAMERVRGSRLAWCCKCPGGPRSGVHHWHASGRTAGDASTHVLACSLRRVVELLRMVKVVAPELRLHSYPHELSGGMRQRVSSAAAIGCAPALLIADEPTTALDVTTQRQYLDLLMELQQATGMAIMFVTHDISLSATCATSSRCSMAVARGVWATSAGAQPAESSLYGGALAVHPPARRAPRPPAEHCG